jgi:protein gp37
MHEIKPLSNLWLGVSVENQAAAEERIPLLCQTPAAIRFISAEPLIGPLDLEWPKTMYPLLYGLDQIIVGGESGHGARPMDPAWARSLRDQCKRWRVAFFCKQMGSVYGEHKGKDLPPDLNIREFPEVKA